MTPTIEEENQAILDEADAIRLEYDFFNRYMGEFVEDNYVDPNEIDLPMIDMDGNFVRLEEPHQPSLEELKDIFTSPDVLKDCD